MSKTETLRGELEEAVLEGEEEDTQRLVQELIDAGMAPLTIVDSACVPGLRRAGALWEEGEYFLPELVTAAQAMTAAMEVLRPLLRGEEASGSAGRALLGTVAGDIHDIGKTLLATLLAANGFAVSDLGTDVSVERFIGEAREKDADLICASALLTTTMGVQRELAAALREAGLRAKLMVGGAPVNRAWADEIGADGYADNAVSAVAVAKELVANG